MFSRRWLAAPVMAAAIGGPYLATEADLVGSAKSQWTQLYGASENASDTVGGLAGINKGGVATGPVTTGDIAGPEVKHFGDVFRFDVTPAWIVQRWARVTTRLADLTLDGYRVPLVTGVQLHDLTGTLTYYFNQRGDVQRITFDGHTGDPRVLAMFLHNNMGFEQAISSRVDLYLVKWNGTPRSALVIRPAAVVRNDQPHRRFDVKMEINRPGGQYQLSDVFVREFTAENGLTFR